MLQNNTRKITLMALLIAIGTFTSHLIWFPAGFAKAYPMQHAINVIAGIFLGPGPAVLIAFMIGLLRNILGIGTLLAFPGGMAGALLAGIGFKMARQRPYGAFIGEVFGTSIIGALLSVPIARLILGHEAVIYFYIPPFAISAIVGAFIGVGLSVVLERVRGDRSISMTDHL
ncbi:energy coupling factor transporter S component ThiW [Natranaerobius thermophilus]|uniref:ThiW protein n=1 Tax=Natranaerobius thermophilus (strain ATCC BAA-1301 / DSM 18059 / JW/NM-WN-LF) TaxID=457570 RepID=B2A1B0_NATTJ|nr:energy coupling factor transporter S component ThiW [Natranaerobius thermophilus]ACB86048.1 thiW protein [Natranaerobius thermophilus JW/NM-WN-LF]